MMAVDNLPYYEAKTAVINQEKKSTDNPPAKSQKNFPSLPQRGNISLINSSAASQSTNTGAKPWSRLWDRPPEVSSRTSTFLERLLKTEGIDGLLDRLEKIMQIHAQTVQRKKTQEEVKQVLI